MAENSGKNQEKYSMSFFKEVLLETVMDNSLDHIYVKDKQSRFVLCNMTVAKNMSGGKPEDLYGKTDHDFYPKELADQYLADEKKILKTGMPLINREEENISHKGHKKWLLTTKVPIKDDNGNIIGILGINKDITGIKLLQEEREKLIKDLQNALGRIKLVSGLLPICTSCKKIRDDKGYWNKLESYMERHSSVEFSHSVCPECLKKAHPSIYDKIYGKDGELGKIKKSD
jgi:PAS domain S-box-containing protein